MASEFRLLTPQIPLCRGILGGVRQHGNTPADDEDGAARTTFRRDRMYYTWFDAPFTRVLIAGADDGLRYLLFEFSRRCRETLDEPTCRIDSAGRLREAVRQLRAYFRGELTEFDLPLNPAGTEFQQRVWAALRETPFSETVTYGQIADRIGRPSASRAVGRAIGLNPIAIVVPCHRVIGRSGRLVGFAGGLCNKRRLLDHERNVPDRIAAASSDTPDIRVSTCGDASEFAAGRDARHR